jgi:hypothetical protein
MGFLLGLVIGLVAGMAVGIVVCMGMGLYLGWRLEHERDFPWKHPRQID